MRHNHRACAQSPGAATAEVSVPKRLCSETREATAMGGPLPHLESSPCSPQLEKRPTQQQRPSTVINKQIKLFLKFTERETLNKGSNVPCYCICKINASPIKLLKSQVEDHAILTSTSRCQSALYGAIRL